MKNNIYKIGDNKISKEKRVIMKVQKETSIIMKIAEREGVSVEQVRKDMHEAILCAYNNPDTKEEWEKLFGKRHIPSAEEFIKIVARQTKRIK